MQSSNAENGRAFSQKIHIFARKKKRYGKASKKTAGRHSNI
jgi:hypothetical protein